MALTILGLSGALSHDPSAALYIDGKLIAAVEEERFVRDKHAKNRMPYESAKFCTEQAGIKPSDVDVVAIPFAPSASSRRRAGTMPSATGTRRIARSTPSSWATAATIATRSASSGACSSWVST